MEQSEHRLAARVTRWALATAAAGAAATLAVALLPMLRFASGDAAAHVATEAAVSVIGALLVALLAGRAVRTGSRLDALVAASLCLLALCNALFSMLPSIVGSADEIFGTWAPLIGRTAGAALFCAAALLPARRLTAARRGTAIALAAAAALTALVALVTLKLGDALPRAGDSSLRPETSGGPRLVGPPALLITHAAGVVLYVLAARGFLRRAVRSADELLLWLGLASILAAVSRLHALLFPALTPNWWYTADALRLASYVLMMIGAVREILEYQRRVAVLRVLDERRRLARELHDGLAQELAFIIREAQRLEPSRHTDRIRAAADRALSESRLAIVTLAEGADRPLSELLRDAAESVALRAGARVEVQGGARRDVAPEVRQALMRIVREAVTNGVRHGHASIVRLTVAPGPPLTLVIGDDGRGFDPRGPRRTDAFGLESMRERAEALGGGLLLRSAPGRGTEVEVTIP